MNYKNLQIKSMSNNVVSKMLIKSRKTLSVDQQNIILTICKALAGDL